MGRLETSSWRGKLRRNFQTVPKPHHTDQQRTLNVFNANRKSLHYWRWYVVCRCAPRHRELWNKHSHAHQPVSNVSCEYSYSCFIYIPVFPLVPTRLFWGKSQASRFGEGKYFITLEEKEIHLYLWRSNAPKSNCRGTSFCPGSWK